MSHAALLDEAHAHFRRRFGRAAAIAAVAPGRVNLIGDHTDYAEGWVLPMAIGRATAVLAAPAAHPTSVLESTAFDDIVEADLRHPVRALPGGFGGRLLAVAAEFQRLGRPLPNLDVLVHGTVPVGAGLSSSAALEVAWSMVLASAVPPALGAVELALLCQRAEHAAGAPCGIMDPLVSAVAALDPGARGRALLIDCRTNTFEPVALPLDRLALLVADTGVRHEIAGGAYAERRRETEEAARRLGVRALRDADEPGVAAAGLPEPLASRAMHVASENRRVLEAAAALRAGDLARFGALMLESHASLRDRFAVSCAELDCIVDAARRTEGVLGARMTGGGFGGCVVIACAREAEAAAIDAVREAFEARFGRPPASVSVVAERGEGARG